MNIFLIIFKQNLTYDKTTPQRSKKCDFYVVDPAQNY